MTGADKLYVAAGFVSCCVGVDRLTSATEPAVIVAIFTQVDLLNSLPNLFFALLHNLLPLSTFVAL